MKAIIMAGGKGSRISSQIGNMPKSMLEINGKPIIRTTTEMLIALSMDVIVCTGYQSKIIEAALTGLNVRFVHNPFYDITNNIASLWFARHEIDDDVILLSADVVFEYEIIKRLMVQEHRLTMMVDKSRTLDGDYFFKLSDDGHILDYGSEIPLALRSCEYIGLSKIRKDIASIFTGKLDEMIRTQNHQLYFEKAILSFNGNEKMRANTIDISGLRWREIDTYDDYLKALQQFQNEEQAHV